MPIYEFNCTSCDARFELFLMSQKEMEKVRCTRCNSPEIKKLLSSTNVVSSASSTKFGMKDSSSPGVQHRKCGNGSCTTFNLPGHTK